MILPKSLIEQMEYFEHTLYQRNGMAFDVFTIHFKQWWRRKRKIKIARNAIDYDVDTDMFKYQITPGAADLYNQLNNWSVQTHDEKLDSVKQKYEPPKDGSNVIQLKPKPKIDE